MTLSVHPDKGTSQRQWRSGSKNLYGFSVAPSTFGTLTLTTMDREPICILQEIDESYTRESSPIDTPGAIVLERTTAEAATSDSLVAGIEHKCLRPTSPELVPLKWSKTSLEVPKCKNCKSSAVNKDQKRNSVLTRVG